MSMVSSNWMEIATTWLTETMMQPPHESWKYHTHNPRACPRGFMIITQSEGRPAATATQATAAIKTLVTPPWKSIPHQP